jgi:hypothetical protein
VLRQNVVFSAHSENLPLTEVDIDDLSDTNGTAACGIRS